MKEEQSFVEDEESIDVHDEEKKAEPPKRTRGASPKEAPH